MEEARFREAFLTLRNNNQMNAVDFARSLGVSKSLVSHIINNNRRKVPARWFGELCREYGVSAEWLLLGKGNMFNNQMTLL